VEVGVARVDLGGRRIIKKDGCLGVVEDIPAEVGDLRDDLGGDLGVELGRDEQSEARRGQEGLMRFTNG
jgi:hypothetical protein